jgi:hypothetical protein
MVNLPFVKKSMGIAQRDTSNAKQTFFRSDIK